MKLLNNDQLDFTQESNLQKHSETQKKKGKKDCNLKEESWNEGYFNRHVDPFHWKNNDHTNDHT